MHQLDLADLFRRIYLQNPGWPAAQKEKDMPPKEKVQYAFRSMVRGDYLKFTGVNSLFVGTETQASLYDTTTEALTALQRLARDSREVLVSLKLVKITTSYTVRTSTQDL